MRKKMLQKSNDVGKSCAPKKHARQRSNKIGRHASAANLEAQYREMARDGQREAEALEWAEGLLEDFERASR